MAHANDEQTRLTKVFDAVFARGDVDEAKKIHARLKALAGGSVEEQVVAARVAVADGDPSKAMTMLERVIAEKPLAALAHAYLGAIKVGVGDVDGALPHLEHAIKGGAHVPAMDHALGRLALVEGRLADAEKALVAAAKRMPESSTTQLYLGQARARLGKLDEAADALSAALEVEPRLLSGVIDLVLVRLEQGRMQDALAVVERGIAALPDESELLRLKVHVCMTMGERARAEETLRAIPDDQQTGEDLGNLAMLLLGKRAFDEAKTIASRAVARDPSFWWPEHLHALALEGTNAKKRDVVAAYERAIQKGDPRGEAGTRLGYVLLSGDDADPKRAVSVLDAALERSGFAPGTALNLALACFKAGDTARARSLAADVAESGGAAPSEREQAKKLLGMLAN